MSVAELCAFIGPQIFWFSTIFEDALERFSNGLSLFILNSVINSSNATKITISTRCNEFNINTRAHGKYYAGCPEPLHHWGPGSTCPTK